MSVLDSDQDVLLNMDNHIKEQALKEFFYASLLTANVSEVETNEDSNAFVNELVEMLDKDNSPLNSMLQRHIGRPVYTLDCRKLRKGDAIGWLEEVAKLPKSPKSILVIENITEIPDEDANHDNPQYLRNVLMHSWKNPMNELFNANIGTSFKIVPADYTIFITWIIDKREKMDAIHQPSDGFAWVGNLEEYFNNFKADFKDESIKDLEETHIISYEK